MIIGEVAVPEIYKESQDMRFFLSWFEHALERYRFEHENFFDLYDPLRCQDDLVWALADTMGYKYDDRLPMAFNRLVLLYFMSMINNRGSKDGVTLAAQTNLAQFNLLRKAKGFTDEFGKVFPPKPILYNRLEDPSIPVNAVTVTANTDRGYIDIVYFSSEVPLDACIEYVRPIGMYCFQHSGVRLDAKTRISIDQRLTNTRDVGMSFGPTHVGHYRRKDYASLQLTRQRLDDTQPIFRIQQIPAGTGKWFIQEQLDNEDANWETVFGPFSAQRVAKAHFDAHIVELRQTRENVWYRNRESESGIMQPPTSKAPASFTYEVNGEEFIMNPGYRTLYSLQLCNNDHLVESLIDEKVFSLGYGPQDFQIKNYEEEYFKEHYRDMYADGTTEPRESVVYPRDPFTNEIIGPRTVGNKIYNLRRDREFEEARQVTNFTTYAVEGEGNEWYLTLNGERIEPDRTYAEKRIAEIRLAIIVPPDIYTTDPERTDIEPYDRFDNPNLTKSRPVVNPIMSAVGDAMSQNPENTIYSQRERDANGKPIPDGKIDINKPHDEV
jgi:hypothetical protein